MSFSLYLTATCSCGPSHGVTCADLGSTGNLYKYMRQASLDLLGLDGRSAHQCVLDLDDAIDDIKEHPMTYAEIGRSLPPDWGNPKQYEDWLISFRDACLRHPYAKVEYSRS